MNRIPCLVLAVGLLFSATHESRAGLVVVTSDLTLAPGGTGFLDVYVGSDAPGGDLLNSATFQIQIGTFGATRLEFVDPQSDLQLIDSNYVFSGDSFDQLFGVPVGTVGSMVVPNDTFTGGDSTASGSDVLVNSFFLLAHLEVTAHTILPPQTGDQFTISLVASGSGFDSTSGPVVFTSYDATVTIGSAIVPEPSSFVLVGCAALTLWLCRFRRFFGTGRDKRRPV